MEVSMIDIIPNELEGKTNLIESANRGDDFEERKNNSSLNVL